MTELYLLALAVLTAFVAGAIVGALAATSWHRRRHDLVTRRTAGLDALARVSRGTP